MTDSIQDMSPGELRALAAAQKATIEALEAEKARGFVSDALRQIAGWMDTGGPTYHEAEMIGMAVSGPTECSSHKQCAKAAKKAFLEAARIWDHMHPPAAPAPAERVEQDVYGELDEDGDIYVLTDQTFAPGTKLYTTPQPSPAPAAPDVAGLLNRIVPRIDAGGPNPIDPALHCCEWALHKERDRIHNEFADALAAFHGEG